MKDDYSEPFDGQCQVGTYKQFMWHNPDGSKQYLDTPIYGIRDVCLINAKHDKTVVCGMNPESCDHRTRRLANVTFQVLVKFIDDTLVWVNVPISECNFGW